MPLDHYVDLAEVIDRRPLGRLQITTTLLCSIVAILDGLDNFAIALVAPAVAQELAFPIAAFGGVFGINSFGMLIGALAFGTIGDRFGRKPVIMAAVFVIGVATLLTPLAGSLGQMLAVRFLVGIGAGGVMPNIIALTADYAPRRMRARLVTLMFAGIPVGSILAGIISFYLMDRFGWRGVFYAGGAMAFVMLPVLAVMLPESIRAMTGRNGSADRSLAMLRRLDPQTRYPAGTVCTRSGPAVAGAPVRRLFQDGRARVTPLLWFIFFCNLLVWFFLLNWMPSVLQQAQFPRSFAVLATIILYGGGLLGGLVLGWMLDRRMAVGVLALAYVAAAGSVAGIAAAATMAPQALLPTILTAGFLVGGCQYGITALAAEFYPTDMRSTGVGWALGIGRLGAIVGPAIGGLLIGLQWSFGALFAAAAMPALLAAAASVLLGQSSQTTTKQIAPKQTGGKPKWI